MKLETARLSVPFADLLAVIWSKANTFDADGGLVSDLSAGICAWEPIVAIPNKVANKIKLVRSVILLSLGACAQDPYTEMSSTRRSALKPNELHCYNEAFQPVF